jgi:hypothetical protein
VTYFVIDRLLLHTSVLDNWQQGFAIHERLGSHFDRARHCRGNNVISCPQSDIMTPSKPDCLRTMSELK